MSNLLVTQAYTGQVHTSIASKRIFGFSVMQISHFSLLLCFCFVRSQQLLRKNFLTPKRNTLDLLNWDQLLISNLKEYADNLEDKIERLKRIATEIRRPLNEAKGREEEYLSNPLHSFPLIRHMYADWTSLEKFMMQSVGQEQIDFLANAHKELPVLEDVIEAEESFQRVEYVYKLNFSDITKGLLHNVQHNISLSPLDCYSMGKRLFEMGRYQSALNWLSHALELLPKEKEEMYEVLGLSRIELVGLIARTLIAVGLEGDALMILNKEPSLRRDVNQIIESYKADPHTVTHVDSIYAVNENYSDLCRGKQIKKPSRLHCRYNTTTTPFLRLAPFKMEELSKDPYIVIYHDVLYDSEIAELDRITNNLMERTPVYKPQAKVVQLPKTRIANGVWLPHSQMNPTDIRLITRILKRIGDITGMAIMKKDKIQFIDYGFGGYYVPHYDYFGTKRDVTDHMGDRIASALFYLNDVPLGGYTVFPALKLAIKPEKGKLLFWHNLYGNNYDFDNRTLHSACPVGVGKKLAITYWIHENAQMFVKPCYGKTPPERD